MGLRFYINRLPGDVAASDMGAAMSNKGQVDSLPCACEVQGPWPVAESAALFSSQVITSFWFAWECLFY